MLGFEESYVLTSADGLAYTSTTPIAHSISPSDLLARSRREKEEARKNQQLKSLREQLRENAEKADAEWKETHNPFMAPKGLDGEEVQWLSDEEGKRKERERVRRLQEERDRMAFEVAVARRKEEEGQGKERTSEADHSHSDATALSFKAESEIPSNPPLPSNTRPSSLSLTSLLVPSSLPLDRLPVVRLKQKGGVHPHPHPSADSLTSPPSKRVKASDPSNSSTISLSSSAAASVPPPLAPSAQLHGAKPAAAALSSLLAYGDDDEDD